MRRSKIWCRGKWRGRCSYSTELRSGKPKTKADTMSLPTVQFGQYQISRLIMGDNPIYGYAHFNQLLSQHQQEAQLHPIRLWRLCAEQKRWVLMPGKIRLPNASAADLQRYRDEGGTIHYFCLSRGGHWYDDPSLIDEAAKHNPIGMAPHGSGVAGRCFQENRLDYLRDILKAHPRHRGYGWFIGTQSPHY